MIAPIGTILEVVGLWAVSLVIGESSRIARRAPARNRRHVARIVSQLLAILDFARIVSALVVVVGVTSHLVSGAALSPRRRRIVLTIAQRCYDCEECCSQSFDF